MPGFKRKVTGDFSGGNQSHTTKNLAGSNQLLHSLNADFDRKLGGAIGRKGSNVVSGGAIAAYRILALFVYKYSTTKKYLAVYDNTTNTIIALSDAANFAGTWATAKSLGTGREVFFENFIGKVFYFTGQDTPQYSDDLDASPTWTNVTGAPTAGKFPFVLNQALHVLTEAGFLWSSDVVDSTGLAFTSTTWTSRGINPNDGQKCTGAIRHRGRGVLFKEESIYRYDGTNEPEAVITVGTHSWRSIIIGADGNLGFHHRRAIYEMGAGMPSPISRPVQKFLDGMDSANWQYVAALTDEKCNYYWIGNVTINDPLEFDNGRTYTDVVLVWNVFTRRWSVYTGWNMRSAIFDETTGKSYFGTAAGKVTEINVAYKDVDGATENAIDFQVMPYPMDYGYPEKDKTAKLIAATGRLQDQLKAADSYDNLFGEKGLSINMEDGVAQLDKDITFKQLWLYYAESYKDTPPFLESFIMDQVEFFEDTK